jgi:hypothetical protein
MIQEQRLNISSMKKNPNRKSDNDKQMSMDFPKTSEKSISTTKVIPMRDYLEAKKWERVKSYVLHKKS